MNLSDRAPLMDSYRPALIPLAPNLTAAAFPLMKIYPAEYCLRRADDMGMLTTNSLIVETSSGTMALGLAIVCRWRGNRLTIVTDPACDAPLRRRLEQLGAIVEIVPAPAARGGYQRARLDRLHAICAATPDHCWVNQYDNPANAAAYAELAAQLVDSLGRVDCLVGTVGSGGSMCGTSRYLRALFPEMHVVGVDTFGSVLFGQPDGPRQLRGLGNSLLPKNVDHTTFDEVHWVSAAEAFTATRILHAETALFRGATSGACWLVARAWAAQHPRARVVCVFPDEGHRYVNTVYDDEYMQREGLLLTSLPRQPREVSSPLDAGPAWSCLQWGRRTYEAIVGASPVARIA